MKIERKNHKLGKHLQITFKRLLFIAGYQWLIPVILATQEAEEIRRIAV
jgi:hypothetical protein